MTPHCDFCADPWRRVILRLAEVPLASKLIARHYGIHKSTVVKAVRTARERGCIGGRRCEFCGVEISTRRVTCERRDCYLKAEKVRTRRRRAHFGRSEERAQRLGKHRRPPPGFVWPALPPNPRQRVTVAVVHAEPLPVLYPERLLGAGNKSLPARTKSRLAAGLMPLPAEVAVLPWRGAVAPPLCPTLGSLPFAKVAA